MKVLPWEKRAALKRMLAAGMSRRAIAKAIPCATGTVKRYAYMWKVSAVCGCGQAAWHNGWCHVRLDFSPQRRGWLADHWGKRSSNDVIDAVDRAHAGATALRHRLGQFVYGGAGMPGLAYSLCAVCGRMARIKSDYSLDGTALQKQCFTQSQLAAIKAANQEQRTWRKAKKELVALRKHLRASPSLTEASTPPPTSCG